MTPFAPRYEAIFELRLAEFQALVKQPEAQLDLATASLYLGYLLYPELDTARYLLKLDELAQEAQPLVSPLSSSHQQVKELARFLFVTCGFTGNEQNYYDVRNSFLNDVLDRRLGIPITLSVVFLEVARRLNLACQGVGMPGHFLVRHLSEEGMLLLDPFHNGRTLKKKDCQELLETIYGSNAALKPEYFRPVTKRQLLVRMLSNLKNNYLKQEDWLQVLRVIEMILSVNPASWSEVRDRGLICVHLKRWSAAINDLTQYCLLYPKDDNLELLKEQITQARKELAQWN